MKLKSRLTVGLAAIAVGLAAHGGVAAQGSNVVRLVVPYAAGGGTDILARQLAEALGAELGKSVIVENKPGAGANIGGDVVARSAADGSTFLLGDMALSVNPSLVKKMPFSPTKDLKPVAMVATAPLVLVVNPSLQVKTMGQLVELARAKPDTLTFASAGLGNPPHIAGELFKSSLDLAITHVPYKGVGPAMNDLIGEQVSMLFTGISSTKPQIDAGRLVALAVTGEKRAPTLPDVPTVAEAGFAEVNVTSWWGIFGPAGLAPETAEAMERATARALEKAKVREQLASRNIDPAFGKAPVLAERLARETAKWAEVIGKAGIAPE